MSKRVLYLSYDGMTDPLGQSQVLPYLKSLSRLGFRFTVVSFEKKNNFREEHSHIQQLCDESEILWCPLNYTRTPPVLSTLRDIWILKKTVKKLHSEKPFSIVHCRSYITALVGLWMKRSHGVKFVFDMRGFWADERVEGGLWSLQNPVYKKIYGYFKNKERAFLTNADYTISLTESAKNEMATWKGAEKFAPIKVIPCCADLQLFNPSSATSGEIARLRERLNLPGDRTVLSYIGSVGTWYMAEEMFDFFKAFLQAKPESVFLIVTKDAKSEIQKLITERRIPLSNVHIVAAQRSEMPTLISLSDFSIFFIKPVYSKKASSPTKQAEIMAMGVPLICNDNIGDTSGIVREYGAGVIVNEFSEQGYKRAIEELLTSNFSKTTIIEGAQSYFSLDIGVKKYAAVYKSILK